MNPAVHPSPFRPVFAPPHRARSCGILQTFTRNGRHLPSKNTIAAGRISTRRSGQIPNISAPEGPHDGPESWHWIAPSDSPKRPAVEAAPLRGDHPDGSPTSSGSLWIDTRALSRSLSPAHSRLVHNLCQPGFVAECHPVHLSSSSPQQIEPVPLPFGRLDGDQKPPQTHLPQISQREERLQWVQMSAHPHLAPTSQRWFSFFPQGKREE